MEIKVIILNARSKAFAAVNIEMLNAYFEIGRKIVEEEQKGKSRAGYGGKVIDLLSSELKIEFGSGFDGSNLRRMRRFYLAYKIWETLSPKLTWSHYCELIKISNRLERNFYEKECIQERWGVRDLRRQIESGLFYRLPAGKKEGGFLQLASEGHKLLKPEDIVKDPYVFEFLKLPEPYSEKELEERIIKNLQMFLLELGKGFSFVARQFRMNIGKKQFYADLVFYNKELRCYVLIDLKISKISHSDVGQMNLYLNYFKSKVNSLGDNEPIGIILSRDKDNIEIKYALGGISSQIFTSKYMLSLPSAEDLKRAVESSC